MTYLVDVGSRVAFPIVGGGDVHNAQIDTHIVADIFCGGVVHIASGEEVELAPDKGQVALALLVLQQIKLVLAGLEGNVPPASQCPDRDFLRVQPELEDAIIVGERAVFSKRAPGFAIQLVAIGHLAQSPDHHLRAQLKALAHIVVAQVMEFELAKELVLPSHLADGVAGCVGPLQGLMQQLASVWVRIELDFGR